MVLEAAATVFGCKEATALGSGQPVATILRRLLYVHDLKPSGSRKPPYFASILAAEDAFFGSSQQNAGAFAVDTNCLGVLAAQTSAEFLPGTSRVATDRNPRAVREVNGIGRIGIHRNIAQFGDIAAGQNLPFLAMIGCPNETVSSSKVEGRRITWVVIQCEQERVIIAGVPPLAGSGPEEQAAGRQLRADDILLSDRHAGVERVLCGQGRRKGRE